MLVYDVSSVTVIRVYLFLCTFGRFMRSFVLERSPVVRNAFLSIIESIDYIFKNRFVVDPCDPTHPIRRVLPGQKGTHKKNFDHKHMQHMSEGRRVKVITKVLF